MYLHEPPSFMLMSDNHMQYLHQVNSPKISESKDVFFFFKISEPHKVQIWGQRMLCFTSEQGSLLY
jgi:hypothetical protein